MYSIFFFASFLSCMAQKWCSEQTVKSHESASVAVSNWTSTLPVWCGGGGNGNGQLLCPRGPWTHCVIWNPPATPTAPQLSILVVCVCVCVPTHCREKQQQELMCSRLKVGPKESHMRALGEGRSTMSQSTKCCLNSLPQVYVLICMRDFELKLKLKAYTKQSFMKICRFKSMVKECVLKVFSSKDQTKMCSFWNAMQYILLDARIIRCD